ncbi:MAG: gamma-glutamyltransferase [Dokdonella sp.]
MQSAKITLRPPLAILVASAMALAAATVQAADASKPSAPTQRPGHAAIASAHNLATDAGLEVIAKGGNAFDAAIAVIATLAVVEPESSGIGGGGLMLLHRASDAKDSMLDARETAPAASSTALYLDANGALDRDKSINGPLSAAIPGQPAALVWLAKNYGKLQLKQSLAPAIRIARAGFKPSSKFLSGIARRQKIMERFPASVALYTVDGQPPKAGWVFKNPDIAATLERIAEQGDDGFYRGEFAQKLVDGVRAAGGNWTLADLESYRVKIRDPITIDYRGWRIVTAPPPSSGGIALAEMLNILSGYDLASLDPAHRTHLEIEAMRRAFRDRAEYLGDPDYVTVPVAELTSPLYAAGLRAGIHPDKATPSDMLPPYLVDEQGNNTSHFSIIDADGNMVGSTQTVNLSFGSAMVVAGTGFVLNNEMDDFALKAGAPNAFGLLGGDANAPKPGHRPLSSMTPSFVIGKDHVGVIGTPGGSRIITMVLEGILSFIDGDSVDKVTAKPRFHHQYLPDVVSAEQGAFSEDEVKKLQAMGHIVNAGESRWGLMNVVGWDRKTNTLHAASDPRSDVGSGRVD